MPHSLKETTKPLEAASALDVLAEYPRGDGLSLKELMDSSKNGGLTYNDFLMLPGHINFEVSARRGLSRSCFSCTE
jgi:IMP dehydrogenase